MSIGTYGVPDAVSQFAASANRRLHFPKRRQLFIGVHNGTLFRRLGSR